MRTIIIVACQPGSAAALAPVVRALREGAGISCLVFGLEHAAQSWAMLGVTAQTVTSFTEAQPYLAAVQPSMLLTGTSFDAVGDGQFWNWAREQGIPSVAFVDHWINYHQRFSSSPDCPFDCLPGQIAVIDALMARRLIEAGCPEERIIITGHPGWDEFIQRRGYRALGLRQKLAGDSTLILFASEPLARFYGSMGSCNGLGYTERDALTLLFNVLETIAEVRKENYTVAVKPHPREDPLALTDLFVTTHGRVQAKLVEGNRIELASAAEVVVGISSLLLYESALMGRPVVALQPGRVGPSDLVDHHPGILLATDHQQAISALMQALTGEMPTIPAPEPAVPRWMKLIAAQKVTAQVPTTV
ncbi:hypothetical protein CCP3SC1_990005 [Gammaproteobacteria bacterium]